MAMAITGFIGASYATAPPNADLPPTLPASALPRVTLADDTKLQLSNSIDEHSAERFGITSDSFENVRLLGSLSAGSLYIVPGTRGHCVVLLPAASCGMLAPTDKVVAVFLPDQSGKYQVGGGITDSSSRQVSLENSGARTSADLVVGGFVLTDEKRVPFDTNTALVVR